MKTSFSSEIRTTNIVQIEADGLLTHGDPDPTSLQISVVDDQGSIHLLVFKDKTITRLAGIILGLTKVAPDAFEV